MGARGYGGGGRGRAYTYRYTVTTRMTCIKMGSDESHSFNVSLIVRTKSQDSVHKPQLLKRKESRSGKSTINKSIYSFQCGQSEPGSRPSCLLPACATGPNPRCRIRLRSHNRNLSYSVFILLYDDDDDDDDDDGFYIELFSALEQSLRFSSRR